MTRAPGRGIDGGRCASLLRVMSPRRCDARAPSIGCAPLKAEKLRWVQPADFTAEFEPACDDLCFGALPAGELRGSDETTVRSPSSAGPNTASSPPAE